MSGTPARGFSEQALLSVLRTLPQPTGYCLAYSGGLDSSVLLHALAGVRGQLPAALRVLHLDHGLHPDSTRWTEHCREQCDDLGLPLLHRRLALDLQPGDSLEAKAREARLATFRDILRKDELLLTAQHRDDQAETLLLQLLRGAGLDGLSAMPPLSHLGRGRMARPLLDFSRADLRQYAEERSIAWIDDPSNVQLHFDRNYLRHQVLPRLAERWPAYADTFSRSAAHCAEARELLDDLSAPALQTLRGEHESSLSVSALAAQPPALCRELLRRWIRERGFVPPSRTRLERIRTEVLTAGPDRSPLVEWPGAQIRRYRDGLYLLPPLPGPPSGLTIGWTHGDVLELPEGFGTLRFDPAATAERLREQGKLSVRFDVTGLQCRPAVNRPHRALKHLYQEQGIPDWVRPYVPLLFLNDQLIGVGPLWTCCGQLKSFVDGWRLHWVGHMFEAWFQS